MRPSLPRPRTPVVDELIRRALGTGVEEVVPLGGLVAERYDVAGTDEPGSTFLG